jgi:translation initiation factor 2 alpha subunit (eIF-2alpha)
LRKLFASEEVKRSTSLVIVMESLLVSEDIFNGVGVDLSSKMGVTFASIEKQAEKDGVQMSKKAIEAEQQRALKVARCSMPVSTFYCNDDVTVQWAFHEEEQTAMLDLLFDWLDGSGAVSSNWGVGGERR